MIHGILICHGDLAESLIATVERILGPAKSLTALSNTGLSPEILYQQVFAVIGDNPDSDVLIMADLRGGSCWTVGRMMTRDFPDIKVVSGINLPMLISFLTKREALEYDDLIEAIRKDATRGIVID